MTLVPRKRPVKVTDEDLLLEIARLQDTVKIGPSTREIEAALQISNGTVFRRTKQLESAGLIKPGYRGLVLTDEGERRAKEIADALE